MQMDTQVLGRLQLDKADWPTPGALNYRLATMQTLACGFFDGNWDQLDLLWYSMLAVPGTVVFDTETNKGFLVLYCSRYGAIACKQGIRRAGRLYEFVLPKPENRHTVPLFITDFNRWKAQRVKVALPGDKEHGDLGGGEGARLIAAGVSQKLIEVAVDNGLRGLTVPFLRKLLVALEARVPGGRAPTELVAMTQLIKAVFKELATDEYTMEVMRRRDSSAKPVPWDIDSPLLEDGAADGFDEDEAPDELWGEIEDERREAARREAAAEARRQRAAAALAEARQRQQLPPPELAVPEQPRAIIWGDAGMSQQQATAYLPPNCNITKRFVHGGRWEVRAPYFGSKSKAFDTADQQSDIRALKFVLYFAWHQHMRAHGGVCPFNLG